MAFCGLLLSVSALLVGFLPGPLFACLMFAFNTSFMVVMANAASLVIDPHREIAGFASSAYGFLTQMTASSVAVLTVPLFDGRLLPWNVSMLALAMGFHRARGVPAAVARLIAHFAALRE